MSLVLAVTLAAGCANRKHREISGSDYVLTRVEFAGNKRFKRRKLAQYLALQETKRVPFARKRAFYESMIPLDVERIEQVYAAHGYYDAEVEDVDTIIDQKRRRVTVRFTIREGEPTRVRELEVRWPDGSPAGPANKKTKRPVIESNATLKVGDVFEVGKLTDSAGAMQLALQSEGYAHAKVSESASVDRTARIADVSFEIRPGPFVRIRAIEVDGTEGVPSDLVVTELDFAIGEPYSPRLLQRIEETAYGMDVFNTVTVTMKEGKPSKTVDLVVEVTESKPQSVRAGVGIGIEPNRWEQRVSGLYTHRNLFGSLARLELRARAGYAELPAIYNPREHGPIAYVESKLVKKGLFEKRLVWTLKPSFELGIQEGYQFYTPSNRLGVSRFFTRFVQLGLSHNLRFLDFFRVADALERNRTLLGLDFRDPYLLSYIEPTLFLYFTDSIPQPKNGAAILVMYDLASTYLGGQFDYHKVTPEVRGYYQPHERVQLAARGQLAFIAPFGRQPATPIDQKLYLGGSNTVRGWGLRRISPRVEDCTASGDCRSIPVGGRTSVLATFELRVRTVGKFWAASFFDMGDVRDDVGAFTVSEWNYSVGPGLRYGSRVGTFRLDVGFRLNQTEYGRNQPIWALHFGLGEAF